MSSDAVANGCRVLGGTPRAEATVRLDRGRRPRGKTSSRGLARIARLAVAALVACPATAAAQTSGFALDGYDPPPAGDRFFSVESAEVPGHKLGALTLTGTTASRLLVVERDGDAEGTALVALRHTLHVGASVSFWSRLKLSATLPIETSSGDDLAPLTAPDGVAAGDLRLGARLVVLGGRSRSYRLAIATRLWLPTGDRDELTSDGDARGSVAALLGGRSGNFVWTIGPSILVRAPVDYADVAIRDELGWAGAAGLLVAGGVGQVALETFGAAALRGDDAFGAATTRAELLASGRLRLGPFVAGAAAGPGLSSGVGTAEVRAVVQLGWAPLPRKNRDDERSPAPVPVLPPPSLPDRDRDGVPDERDACPDRPGPPSELPEASGCPGVDIGVPTEGADDVPVDRDGDTVLDADDACPTVRGIMTVDRATNGCPPDSDGDGARDDLDACPGERGPLSADRTRNGCPTKVRVGAAAIELVDGIDFVAGGVEPTRQADETLAQVVAVMREHPELSRLVVVAGGDKGARRAAAIKSRLVALGADGKRLGARAATADEVDGEAVAILVEGSGKSVAAP